MESGGEPEVVVESRWRKFKQLMFDNPLLPAGILFTGIVLANGARHMRTTDARLMQRMMRWRIYGQGASLALLAYASVKVTMSLKQAGEEEPK
ncbi:unnamed protein product [Schistocephalus solidus]|uniref:HIG1 domain-containing protein n=1 Tax=Schistocephalus solidus TaxID=70667 RepID=A0A183TG03_SCHSO|nr:unnamed protein product [Schistocephalus solidus]